MGKFGSEGRPPGGAVLSAERGGGWPGIKRGRQPGRVVGGGKGGEIRGRGEATGRGGILCWEGGWLGGSKMRESTGPGSRWWEGRGSLGGGEVSSGGAVFFCWGGGWLDNIKRRGVPGRFIGGGGEIWGHKKPRAGAGLGLFWSLCWAGGIRRCGGWRDI